MNLEQQLEECRKFIASLAWMGSNGSPFTEEQAKNLETRIQNNAWEAYKRIFGRTP